ncbi:MAG: orotate phosphoribosyltransferase [Myxococcales bacterium]|nr:orotate phosphoribosyltransferase [Myxococcales bacterium]
MSEARARLLARLRADAVQTGSFVLASGRASEYLVDCKRVVLGAEGHRLVAECFLEVLGEARVDAVAGVALGGCPLASAVSLLSGLRGLGPSGRGYDALYVRKEPKAYGAAAQIEGLGARAAAGLRVALLEDVLTTGGSSLRAVETLRAAGLTVEHVWALVDREEGAREALRAGGVTAHSLFRRAELVG